jgi:hypothetical protein
LTPRPYIGAPVVFTSALDRGRGYEACDEKFEVYAAVIICIHADDSVCLRIFQPYMNDYERDCVFFSSAKPGTESALGYWNWARPQEHPRPCMPPKRPPSGELILDIGGQ